MDLPVLDAESGVLQGSWRAVRAGSAVPGQLRPDRPAAGRVHAGRDVRVCGRPPGLGCRLVDYAGFVDQIEEQATAMRAAVVAAGPDATVPTCPKWTVRQLVRHLTRVHQWVVRCLVTDPDGEQPHPDEPPAGWDELLLWFDEQHHTLVDSLRARTAGDPAWVFVEYGPLTAGWWERRQAHETAIH